MAAIAIPQKIDYSSDDDSNVEEEDENNICRYGDGEETSASVVNLETLYSADDVSDTLKKRLKKSK